MNKVGIMILSIYISWDSDRINVDFILGLCLFINRVNDSIKFTREVLVLNILFTRSDDGSN